MARVKRTVANLEKELKSARSAGRNARERMKQYKQGIKDGLELAKEARRD